MAVPSLKSLLAEIDMDTHAGRVRRVALLGRDNAGSKKLGDLLDQLTALGEYWHRLAQHAALAAGDTDRLAADLTASSAALRRFAFKHLLATGSRLDEMLETYPTLSTVERLEVTALVRGTRDPALCERLLNKCRVSGADDEAARLLAGCSATVVAELLPELDHLGPGWGVLGSRHPMVFLDYLERQLSQAPRSRVDQIWRTTFSAAQGACPSDPERVLRLLETAHPRWPAAVLGERLGMMVRAFPARVTGLLLHPDLVSDVVLHGAPRGVLTNVQSLAPDDRLRWVRALRDAPQHLARFLKRLAPSDRPTIVAQAYEGVDTSAKEWPNVLLEVFPRELRAAEARRMLGVRAVAEDRVRTVAVTAFLPIAEARPVLEEALRAAQAEDRAVAYGLLVACTRRSRSSEELGVTLATLRRLRNEQDPVRLAAMAALAATPASLFDNAHLSDVAGLASFVVEARDSSAATVHHLRVLVLNLLVDLPADQAGERTIRVLETLDCLAGPAGTMNFGPIGRRLRRGGEEQLLAALLSRLKDDAKRDRYDLTCSLATGLGRRAWNLDALQDLLRLAVDAPLQSTVRKAIDLWLSPPGPRDDRVGYVVGRDPSTLALPSVLRAVSARRQDLLDVLFRAKPIKGRFLSGKVRHVPIIETGLSRWLPRQHDAYADALRQLIKDSGARPWVRSSAVRALARLPGIGADRVRPLLDSPSVDVVEAALAGLAWSDEPDRQLARLLSYADSDRARVAIYAATRCARFTRPAALGEALAALLASPGAKVTSRKEAIRLLARHRTPGALDQILRAGAEDGVHRDIRIATGRSLLSYLDDDRAWSFLAGQTETSADEAKSLLETGPWQIAARHRARFGQLVSQLTAHRDPQVKTIAFYALSGWSSWVPAAEATAAGAIADLASGSSWQPAVRCLVSIFADGSGEATTVALVEQLATRDDGSALECGTQRDRPSRQRLVTLVNSLASLDLTARQVTRTALDRCADTLAGRPTAVHLEAALRLAAADLSALSEPLVSLGTRLAGRTLAASQVAATLRGALQRDRSSWEPDSLAEPADRLAALSGPAAALLALELVRVAGPRSGWGEQWRDRLRRLRRSPHPDVALAALETFTAAEASQNLP